MSPIARTLLVLTSIPLVFFALACGGDDDSSPVATPAGGSIATEPPAEAGGPSAGSLQLTSSAFEDNAAIPVQYTCDGDSISPPLAISGVPEDTAALALIVVDIDGPGGGFVHWTVWNIDPATTEVPEGAVPGGGTEGQTSLGDGGYFGPCPPSGVHRYVFTLYALDAALVLDAATSGRAEIEAAMEGHALESADLTGTYSR